MVRRISSSTSARESGTHRCLDPFKPGKNNISNNNQILNSTLINLNLREKNLSKSSKELLQVLQISTRDGVLPPILNSCNGESNI